MPDAFRSERLMYRAVEEDDSSFLMSLGQDSESFDNAAPYLPVPQGKAGGIKHREFLDSCLLAVIICLPPPATLPTVTSTADAAAATVSKPVPIGIINLTGSEMRLKHHRNTSIGLIIARQYQAQGYGTEAVRWILHWAFIRAGLHKVEIGAMGHNPRAVKLYERLGFVTEGVRREHFWYNGQWSDCYMLSMLDHEWKEKYGNKATASSADDTKPAS